MRTGITGLSRAIVQLDDAIEYFLNVNNKHCRQFFEVMMALLMKRNSKEKDYIGWSSMLLLFYASKQCCCVIINSSSL